MRFYRLLGALVMALPGLSQIQGADQTPPSAPRIAVVNVAKVFANYRKTQDLERDLRATRDQKQQIADQKRNEIAKLREAIALLEIGTEDRKKQEEDLQRKQVEFQSFQKVTADSLANKRREATEKLYAEVVKAIADYGKEQKLDLIVKIDDTPLSSDTLEELLFKINQKNVVYFAPALDVTDAVIHRLNEAYSKEVIEK